VHKKVRFEIRGELGSIAYCHCARAPQPRPPRPWWHPRRSERGRPRSSMTSYASSTTRATWRSSSTTALSCSSRPMTRRWFAGGGDWREARRASAALRLHPPMAQEI